MNSHQEHPTAYATLELLRPSNKITTSRQALIPFSIRPYCGEVLCDVLPMDAFHLLLGRPWLCDDHVIHDGYASAYSVKHNRKSLTLASLPLFEPHKAKLRKTSEKSSHMSEM